MQIEESQLSNKHSKSIFRKADLNHWTLKWLKRYSPPYLEPLVLASKNLLENVFNVFEWREQGFDMIIVQ
jgi:hypothetical protein